MSAAIELNKVSKRFGQFDAVKNLSFTVNSGDIYGFLGPNGSGKSTTLRMMMGLIQPSQGEILFFGSSLRQNRSNIMKRIGCMIEKPDFYGYLNGIENIQLFARYSGLTYTQKQYVDLFKLVGLHGREKDKVKTFSHGMKQRLGLAQVLIHNPDIIILDEPNTGLDPKGILDLRNLILQLNKEQGKTILFSSHILSEVQEICTDMIVIHRGESVAQGKVSDLLSEEKLQVSIEVKEMETLANYIQQSPWKSCLESIASHEVTLALSKSDIAALVNDIHGQHLSILRVDYKNPLEAYFLKITQNQA